MTLTPFHGIGIFLCPLKISGNLWFSDVFQGAQKETSAMKWFKGIFNKCLLNIDIHACFTIEKYFSSIEKVNLTWDKQTIPNEFSPLSPPPKKKVKNFKLPFWLTPPEVGENLRFPKAQQNCPPIFLGGFHGLPITG